jgi:hypothetical protein
VPEAGEPRRTGCGADRDFGDVESQRLEVVRAIATGNWRECRIEERRRVIGPEEPICEDAVLSALAGRHGRDRLGHARVARGPL